MDERIRIIEEQAKKINWLNNENELLKKHLSAFDWISTADRLPDSPGETVLCIASGTPRENITLIYAMELAAFYPDEGWIVEKYPDWDSAEVTHWMPLPPCPWEADSVITKIKRDDKNVGEEM